MEVLCNLRLWMSWGWCFWRRKVVLIVEDRGIWRNLLSLFFFSCQRMENHISGVRFLKTDSWIHLMWKCSVTRIKEEGFRFLLLNSENCSRLCSFGFESSRVLGAENLPSFYVEVNTGNLRLKLLILILLLTFKFLKWNCWVLWDHFSLMFF